MRFLFFAAQYLPTVGGVERYTHSLASALIAQGHAATVVTSALPGLPAHEVSPEGIEVFRLPSHLLMGGRFPVLRKNSAFRSTVADIFGRSYDFAVINTRFYHLSLWAAKQCKARGIPALVLEHGTKHLSLDNALLNLFGNAYEHIAMKLVRRNCDELYGVSKACADWLSHFHVAAKGVLYNAVDADALDAITASPPCRFRERFEIPEGAPLVAFIGRFILEKGVWELLDAFALLRERLPNATLVMAGDGPLFTQVRAKAPAGVILTGPLPYEESVSLMAQADTFCLPTYSEGFSSTILEAAAVGACIVTTPTGGSPELIESGESGILLDSIDPAEIARVLENVLRDSAFRQKAGSAVRHTVRQRFTWASTAGALAGIARAATGQGRQ